MSQTLQFFELHSLLKRIVHRVREQIVPVVGERDAGDCLCVTNERELDLIPAQVPRSDLVVYAAEKHKITRVVESHTCNLVV